MNPDDSVDPASDAPGEPPVDEAAAAAGTAVGGFDPDSEFDLRLRELRDLEDGYVDLDAIPLPRRADRMDPDKRKDLQFFSFGCALLLLSLTALAVASWRALRALN